MQEIYAAPLSDELMAQRIREIKDAGVLAAASLTPQRVRAHYEGGAGGGARRARHPGHGRLRRARLALGRAAEPQGVHRLRRRPVRRRRLRQLPDRAAPHAHGRGRRAGRRRARRGVHHARRARRRRPAGDRDRRRGRGARAAPAGDRPLRQRDRRRRHAHRRRHRQGHRLRRRRGDGRLAAGPGQRGARPRHHWGMATFHPTLPARRPRARRSRWRRWRRSCSARPTRTTARST